MGSTHLPIVGFNASTTPSLSTLRQVNSAGAAFQSSSPSRTSKKKSRRVKSLRDDGDGSVSDPAGSIRQGLAGIIDLPKEAHQLRKWTFHMGLKTTGAPTK